MKLAGRIPVQPLDDERLTNIERRVVAGAVDAAVHHRELRAPRRHARRALVVAAVATAGLAGWALRGGPGPGPVIAEPAPIQVQTDRQRSMLDIGDATIASDPATMFAVTRPGGGVLVTMTRGKVELEVGKRSARPPLVVRAGDTEVIVVGTRFTVDYGDGRGDVDVRVREGVVRVVHHRQETRVAAGEGWRTRTGLVATIDRASSPATGSGPAATPPGVPGGDTIALGPTPEVSRDRRSAVPEVLHDRKAVAPDVPVADKLDLARAPGRPRPVRGDGRRQPVTGPGEPLVDLTTAIRAQPVEPALDLGEVDAGRAIAAYSDIAAHRSGAEASQAFYSIAVVDHLKLGRNSDALRWLDAYVRRFPGGKEYRAALWLRVRILCLTRLDDRCRAAAYTYLHEVPDGPAVHVVERLTLTE